ncbi:MAG: hypothetical protein A2885_09475 [Sphingopyxis sp. RIFCSPHIGHO2_01_FULL_65_24]|nr:MAG: hypothetical protein A2885_09475 [Sphingopyxis sp. RIFCSPHIGHO2_01_FULL_65_24]
MANRLTGQQMHGLTEALRTNLFDDGISAIIMGFVREQNAAGWPPKTGANSGNRAEDVVELARAVGLKGFEDAGTAPRSTGRFSDVTLADSVDDIVALAKEMGLKGFTDVAPGEI